MIRSRKTAWATKPDWHAAFLVMLPKVRLAESLATGESTNEVAREFKVSAAQISQLRQEFHESWQEFHGECTEAA